MSIRITFLEKLIENPSMREVGLYRQLFPIIFPSEELFVKFLRGNDEQQRLQEALRIFKNIRFTLATCIPFSPYVTLFETEKRWGAVHESDPDDEKGYFHRAHVEHCVNLYLIGLYLFFYSNRMRKTLTEHFAGLREDSAIEDVKIKSYSSREEYAIRDFLYCWKTFSFCHDFGYVYELEKDSSSQEPRPGKSHIKLKDLMDKMLNLRMQIFQESITYGAVKCLVSIYLDRIHIKKRRFSSTRLGQKLSEFESLYGEVSPEDQILAGYNEYNEMPPILGMTYSRMVTVIFQGSFIATLINRSTGETEAFILSKSKNECYIRKEIKGDLLMVFNKEELLLEAIYNGDPLLSGCEWKYYIDPKKPFLYGSKGLLLTDTLIEDALPAVQKKSNIDSVHDANSLSTSMFSFLEYFVGNLPVAGTSPDILSEKNEKVSNAMKKHVPLDIQTQIEACFRESVIADLKHSIDDGVTSKIKIDKAVREICKEVSKKILKEPFAKNITDQALQLIADDQAFIYCMERIISGFNAHIKDIYRLNEKFILEDVKKNEERLRFIFEATDLENRSSFWSRLQSLVFSDKGKGDPIKLLKDYRTPHKTICHGIASAHIMIEAAKIEYDLLQKEGVPCGIVSNRLPGNKNLRLYMNKSLVGEAILAVLLHNINLNHLKNFSKDKTCSHHVFREEPFVYFATMCDHLQVWDRHFFVREDSRRLSGKILSDDIDIKITSSSKIDITWISRDPRPKPQLLENGRVFLDRLETFLSSDI